MILPQTFSLGYLVIHYYGVTMSSAVLLGYLLAGWRARNFGLSREYLDKLFLWLVIGGFVGARSYHIISVWQYYLERPMEVLQVWHGGLSIFGAIIGGFIILLWYSRRKLGLFSTLLDWLSPGLLLGQIIGRFGNLFNYELIGKSTDLPWGMYVPEQFRVSGFEDFSHFHPFPIYEQLLNLGWLLILLCLEKRLNLKERPGTVFGLYLLGYGLIRFFLEWVRLDTVKVLGFVPVNAIVSLCLAVTGGIVYYNAKFKKQISK